MFLNLLTGSGAGLDTTTFYIILGVIAVLFIAMSVFNNKQRKKQMAQEQAKKDSLCPDTKIITIGGIIGTVVSVDHEENTFVMVSEGSTLKFDKRAIYQMTLPENAVQAPVEEAKEESASEEIKG